METTRQNITWPRALLWSAATGLGLAGMFAAVLVGWKWANPGDPFIASLDFWEVLGLLGAIFGATFATLFYWFTFLLADRRAGRGPGGGEAGGKPRV